LRACGEVLTYNSIEIGLELDNLGVSKKRYSEGVFVLFDQNTGRRIHQWARALKIGTSVPGCRDCVQPPAASEKPTSAV
jgi:hypothetical protein